MTTLPQQIQLRCDGSTSPRTGWDARIAHRIAQSAGAVVSFEMTLLLFVFAGIYKSDPRIAWFPVDWTLFFFGVNVLQAGWIVTRRGFRLPRQGTKLVVIAILFVGYAAFSLLWSEGTVYARQKVLHMALLVLWAMAGCALIVTSHPERLHRFLRLLLVFAAWVVLESARFYVQHPGARLITALGGPGSYLGLGRVVGLGTLIAFYQFAFVVRKPFARLVMGGLLFAGLVMGVLIGSRGPLIATAISLVPLIGLALSRRNRNGSRGLIAIGLIGGLLAGIVGVQWHLTTTGRLPGTLMRLTRFFDEAEHYSESGASLARWDYLTESARLWSQRPMFGHGIGSFPVLVNGIDARDYPHNLIAEVASELGLCGLILLAGLLLIAVKPRNVRVGSEADGPENSAQGLPRPSRWSDAATRCEAGNRSLRLLILMLLLHALLNALVSGDIPANRTLFAMLGLAVMNTDKPSQAVETWTSDQQDCQQKQRSCAAGSPIDGEGSP